MRWWKLQLRKLGFSTSSFRVWSALFRHAQSGQQHYCLLQAPKKKQRPERIRLRHSKRKTFVQVEPAEIVLKLDLVKSKSSLQQVEVVRIAIRWNNIPFCSLSPPWARFIPTKPLSATTTLPKPITNLVQIDQLNVDHFSNQQSTNAFLHIGDVSLVTRSRIISSFRHKPIAQKKIAFTQGNESTSSFFPHHSAIIDDMQNWWIQYIAH